ncbi:MAG: phosphate/phosphite/phosphonate ABC transporter substrate-binding protein [Nitrospiraceae bacterium]|nr:MAG: phosphate/phosphite/phosphonate ABC transporter substrate-binding protein [Nitrospiraceae bacterium]
MTRRIFLLIFFTFFISGTVSCSKDEDVKRLDLSEIADIEKASPQTGEKPLRIAVGGMITPKEGFAYYKKFLDYIGGKIDRKVEFVDREDYAEINTLLENGFVDAAFVCGGPYVDGHDQFGLELLAAPVAYGKTTYHSYIIVPKNSPVSRFEELRGKTFAFTYPQSNSGKLAPAFMLAQMGETPESFFKSYTYTRAHDKSIRAVAAGIVDGAAVDSLIWEYDNLKNPAVTSGTRIIKKSPPYGIPPFVARPGLSPEIKEGLRNAVMNAHNDEKGREILKGMMLEKFVSIDDSAYDSIREMKRWLAKQNK